MPHLSFRTRWAGPIALLAAVGVGLSCRDALSPVPQPAIRSDAVPAPYTATFALGSPDDPKDTMELNEFTERRVVRITLGGTLTATHEEDPANNPDRVLGPGGYADCTARVYVIYAGNQGTYLPYCGTGGDGSPMTSAPVQVQGRGRVFREGYGEGGNWRCASPRQEEFCWRFSGSQQVSVEVVDFDGRLDTWYANGFRATIPASDYVYFNWTVVNSAGNPPVETYDWKFVPADGSPPDSIPIPYGANNQPYKVPESGTMYVNVKINGIRKTLSQYIHVGEPTLTLAASPTKAYVGDTVHFSAEIKPDSTTVTNLRWFWFPEQPIMSALRANVTKVQTGSSPTAALSQTSDSVEVETCAGDRTCDHVVTGRGGMRVHAMLAGVPKHDDRDIDVRHARLRLAVKPKRAIKGKMVYFLASASSSDGSPAAFDIDRWTWKGSDGLSADVCTPGYPDCPMQLFRSGTMRAIGTVDGAIDTAYVSISAFDCDTTGVPELDDLEMRDSLDVWYQRRRTLQREGLVVINSDGDGGFTWIELNTPEATVCSTWQPNPPLDSSLLGGLMVHPHFSDLIVPGKPLPLQCRGVWECDWSKSPGGPVTILGNCDPPERPPENIPDPAGVDWAADPMKPSRQAIFRPDSVITFRTVDDWMSKQPGKGALDRSSVQNWRSCLANPL